MVMFSVAVRGSNVGGQQDARPFWASTVHMDQKNVLESSLIDSNELSILLANLNLSTGFLFNNLDNCVIDQLNIQPFWSRQTIFAIYFLMCFD